MEALAVVLSEPKCLELRRLQLHSPGESDVCVQIEYTGVSTGTEKLLYDGQMPWFPGLNYPLVPGYESIGVITRAGHETQFREGDRVFVPGANCFEQVHGLFGGAASTLITGAQRIVRIDESLGERAILLSLAATAHHVVAQSFLETDCYPQVVVGHGVLGRLIARIIVGKGGPAPVVWEHNPARRSVDPAYAVIDPSEDENKSYQHICDASGSVDALDNIISHLARGGQITLAGFYKDRVSFDFAPAFMRELRWRILAEWTQPDLAGVIAMVNDGSLSLDGLITHHEPACNAPQAYKQAFTDPDCLKMVLDWRSVNQQGSH
jgi:3-hydroxyethyl bacteriochlorophyllide a dehydrogenase